MTRLASSSLLLVLAACGGAEAETALQQLQAQAPDPDAIRVEVARLAPSRATLTLELPGEVRGAEDAVLSTSLGGLVEAVLVHEGEAVRQGQVLVRVDGEVYAAQHDQAVAQLEQAESDLRRTEGLGDLATDAERSVSRTQVKVAEANVRMAKANLDRAVIRAPFSGQVGQVGVERGELANPGTPLVRLVVLDPVEVSLSVSDRDVVALEPGLPARVRTQAVSAIRHGEVAEVSPVADLSTRSFVVKVRVPNPDKDLLPGMIATVEVDRVLDEEAIVIPQDWVVTKLDGYGVFVASGGAAHWRSITLGDIVRGQVVVTDGLAPDERVVVVGQHRLVDGDTLLIAREGTCCEDGRAVFSDRATASRQGETTP